MLPIAEVIHNYYDKQRRLNYIRVTRMLSKGSGTEGEEPMPNLESESDSSNPQEEEDNNSLQTPQETVLPQSLINSLYLKKTHYPNCLLKTVLADTSNSRSFNGLCGVLAGIFKDPILDCSSFSNGFSHRVDTTEPTLGKEADFPKPLVDGPILLRDSLLLKKKKSPALINMQHQPTLKDKKAGDALHKIDNLVPAKNPAENNKQTPYLKKKQNERPIPTNIVQKALQRHEGMQLHKLQSKDKKPDMKVEDSAGQLKKSYQNLNIHININFNERKKEQMIANQKEQAGEPKEETKKDYPKLNLFSLITKTKKHSIVDGVATTHDSKAVPSQEKTISSLEFVKVFKKKASEPETNVKAIKQTFIRKNSKAHPSQEFPRSAANQAEEMKIFGKDLMFLPKKHSVSSSINSIQQAIMAAGCNRMSSFKSAERTDSATKKNIDIFEKKRKVSMLSNQPSTKSKKDLRSSMKSQKLTSYRNNSSSTKMEPRSSRQGKVSKSAKKNTRKLFMSQDFNQSPLLMGGGTHQYENKHHGLNIPATFQQSLKGNVLNQANLLTSSQNKRFALFGPKYSSAKESSADPFGNLTYRSKKSSSKYMSLHGGGSDIDIAGKRKKFDRNVLKFSETNLHQHQEQVISMPKKKRVVDAGAAIKHSRVKSDLKAYSKLL